MTKVNRSWLAATVFIGATNLVRAMYFDWSDVGGHLFVAALCCLIALRWPKLATSIVTLVLLVSVVAFALAGMPTEWRDIDAGDSLAEVQAALGPSDHNVSSLAEAERLDLGYSMPSPIRFRGFGAAAIYVSGEKALWLFHNGKVVEATFVGGS